MKKLFEIKSDCLGIVDRIKAIDGDYFIMRNLDTNKFELHHSGQKKGSYCLTLPFDCLDERSVFYVLKTRVQNSDEIFKEIDSYNQKLEKANIKNVLNNFKEKLYES